MCVCVRMCVRVAGDRWPRRKKGEIASREVAKKAREKKDFGKKDLVEGNGVIGEIARAQQSPLHSYVFLRT